MPFNKHWFAVIALAGSALLLQELQPLKDSTTAGAPGAEQSQDGFATLQQAVEQRRSEVWFEETRFTLYKQLEDDTRGDRHQRFLVKRSGLPNLLIAHNIDLAPRAPLSDGVTLYIKGRYEWNNKGGVIHWTHHDPQRREPGGWIRIGATKYE